MCGADLNAIMKYGMRAVLSTKATINAFCCLQCAIINH